MAEDLANVVREKLGVLDSWMHDVDTKVVGLADQVEKTRLSMSRPPVSLGSPDAGLESLGGLVAKSAELQSFMSGRIRGAARIAVPGRIQKTTIVISPTLRPGAQSAPVGPLPYEPMGVLDLLPALPLKEGTLQAVRQTGPAAPGAAVQVVQGDAKPEQTIPFATVQLAPETLAAWVPVSRQAAMDVSGLMSAVNGALLASVKTLEEAQILNGTSTFAAPVAGQLTGLNTNAPTIATTAATGLDAIADLLGALIAAGVAPNAIVLNPGDALALAKAKNGNDEYLLGPPSAAFSNMLWGVSAAISGQQPAGTVLAGNFRLGARLWFREDAVVEISSEHSDFFIKNLLAVRAEERVLLEIVSPNYFGKTTLPAGATVQSGPATDKTERRR